MHHPAARTRRWIRRSVALAGAAGIVAMLSLAPATAYIQPAGGQLANASKAATANAASRTYGPETKSGPQMYDPKTRQDYPGQSSVTVSQVSNLTNQFVNISWKDFTPSNNQGLPGGYGALTLYPVEAFICRGTNPANPGISNCDGATQRAQEIYGADGPTTEVYALTGKAVSATEGGSGSMSIQVQTVLQNSQLGCDESNPCSLVVMPIDGGDDDFNFPNPRVDCGDHKTDVNDQGATTNRVLPSNYTCAWNDRIVFPLYFQAGGTNCQFSNPDFTVVGSPLLQRAMASWIAKLCSGSNPLHFSFEGTVNEPDARSDFFNGADDVALTTEPATPPDNRKFTYAPLGISAESVAFWMDNPANGNPYPAIDLNPRLVAKLVTTSYNYALYGCTKPQLKNPPPPPGCDPAVYGAKADLFSDPDFTSINKGVKPNTSAYQSDFITVLSGNSDMTWELTRWMAANPATVSFLNGYPDPWGMRVNTNYLRMPVPEDQLTTNDGFLIWTHEYSPQFPLSRVVFYQAGNWNPGTFYQTTSGGGPPTFPANPEEDPGFRDQLAILDEGDAAALDLPVAGLLNHENKYVTPTLANMSAAVSDMTVAPNGITRDDNEDAANPNAYPLTMVVYAMVPTSGLSHTKAEKIASWLRYVAGPGQTMGSERGELPAGYLPLPEYMRKQTLTAASEVLRQGGSTPGRHSSGPPASKSSPSSKPSSSPSSSPGSSSNTTSPSAAKVNASYSSPDSSSLGRWLLPLLLVAGGLLALAGPSALVLGRPGGRAALIAGWNRVRALGHFKLPGRK